MCRRLFLTFFCCLAALIFLAVPIFGQEGTPETIPQYSTKKEKKSKGPRAIAVLEWTSKGPRLIPVSLMIDGTFYDAGLYMAQPVPMALDSGVVYEVRKAGEALGDFTLNSAEQTSGGAWVGLGSFESKADQKKKEEAAKAAAAEAKDKTKEEEDTDQRPVLKRSQSGSDDQAAQTAPERKPDTSASSTQPQQKPVTSATPAANPESHDSSGDVGRPILRRGHPMQDQVTSLRDDAAPMKKLTPPPPGLSKTEVAVSDATRDQPHPYTWSWANPEEQQKMTAQAEKMATDALADYAAKTGGPKPGKLEDVEINAYDLSYSNAPDIILTAKALPKSRPATGKRGAKTAASAPTDSGLEYYVTIVGREDIYGNLQKTFMMPTDNRHLDAFPRMHFIDAIDVDGNGAGDLLFRSTSDRSNSFVIYRDLDYKLDEVIRVPEPKG